MKRTKENAGITLIALVITIIVLLILAGISIITLTGQNGILTQANKAKQESELGEERERAGLVSQELKIEKAQGKDVDKTGFQKMVDSQFGSSKATGDVEDSTYVIVVGKTGNIYLINEDGTIDEAGNKNDMKKDENPGVLEDLGNNTYAVNSIEDLVALSYTVSSETDTYEGKTVTLGRNLYFNGMFDSYANPDSKYELDSNRLGYIPSESAETTIKELVTTGDGFISIGVNADSRSFKGTFDGKNNYIDGLYINKKNMFAGLFGTVSEGAKIINIGITSGNIENGGFTGAIVGLIIQGNDILIENCYNKANVTGTSSVGGILGGSINRSNSATIKNCYNTGKITGNSYAGGIAGMLSNVSRSYNTGEVTGSSFVGGILGNGENNIYVEDSYNTGNVKSTATGNSGFTSGIVGENCGTIINCYNTGKIEGGRALAGIISDYGNKIVNCYNSGELKANSNTESAGGIMITRRF